MDEVTPVAQRLRELLTTNELRQAADLLVSVGQKLPSDLRNEAILQAGRVADTIKGERLGLHSATAGSASRQQVAFALLQLVDEIESRRIDLGVTAPAARSAVAFRDLERSAPPDATTHRAPPEPHPPRSGERRIPGGEARCRLLFLAANPSGTAMLSLDEECREIGEKIRGAEYRDQLEFVAKWAVQPQDLLQHLNEVRPHIVHFSGHGSPSEEIMLQDSARTLKTVSKVALRHLFATLKDNVRVVILNACYSRAQAEAITEVIDCAIGMNRAIGDLAAITFAAAFYRAIGFGRSVQEAFDQGTTALLLEGIPEDTTPELLVKSGADPRAIYLIG